MSVDELSSPPRLELQNVGKRFGDVQAVSDVTLSVRPGEIHALCGHNGAGKSTVVNMTCGLLQPDAGNVLVDGERVHFRSTQDAQTRGIALVDQELSVVPTLTVAENLMLGTVDEPLRLRRSVMRAHARTMLDNVGLSCSPDVVLGDLSIGERQLVEIARGLGRGAKVLLLDEPTATLSRPEIELVFKAVRATSALGCAVIFVSHRLGEVIELCDRVTVIRDGRTVAVSSTKNLRPHDIVEAMLGEIPDIVRKSTGSPTSPILRIRGLSTPGVFADVDLDVSPGRIVAIAGQIGSGASDVLRAVAGLHPTTTGAMELDGKRVRPGSPRVSRKAGIAFASGDRKGEGLFLSKDVRRNLLVPRLDSLSRWGVLRRRPARRAATVAASLAGISDDRLRTPVRNLSGGNQQKVLVGRSLDDPSVRVLVLDEPTRGVDVGGRAAIHRILRETAAKGVAIVFASTELDELIELADTVVTMRGGTVVKIYEGNASESAVLNDITHAGDFG